MTLEEARARLNLSVDMVPEGSSNRPGNLLQPTKITIHNTDNEGATADALAHARYQKGADARQRKVSWHFTVDDHRVVQSLPVNERGWHAGSGNLVSLGIEICENAGADEAAAIDRAALLTAILAREHSLDPLEDVVQHNHWTGKNCPHRLREKAGAWTAFKEQVKKYHGQIEGADGDECTTCEHDLGPTEEQPKEETSATGQEGTGQYSARFIELVRLYRQAPIPFPQLKAVTLAQWIFESDRGKSLLAEKAQNFAALKWQPEMAAWAAPVSYTDAIGGRGDYCAFGDLGRFILGYWYYLDREVFDGWEQQAGDPAEFLRYLARKGFTAQADDVDAKILPLLPEAKTLLEEIPPEISRVRFPDLKPIIEKPLNKVLDILDGVLGNERGGYEVRFYRGDYRARQEAANADRCVAYVEQHFNAGRSSDGYSLAVTSSNASEKSKDWGRAYAKAIAAEFGCSVGGEDGIAIGGFNGRGNGNLFHTNMPAILLEPLFATDPTQAEFIRSDAGQDRLAEVLVATIREFFPQGGRIAFSVGHKYKTSNPSDRGVDVVGGGTEADCAELVLQKAERLLTSGERRREPVRRIDETPGAQVESMGKLRVAATSDGFASVRKEPKKTAPEVDRLAFGTVVDVFGKKSGWCKIDLNQDRWVSASVLEDAETPQPEEGQRIAGLEFDLPAPQNGDLGAAFSLWGTYYYGQAATEISDGIVLRNKAGKAVGPAISQADWCHGAMEGTLVVTQADGTRATFNYEAKGSTKVTSCKAFFPNLAPDILAGTERVTWKIARGPFGDGAANLILSPFRSLAVDKTKLPLGTAIYIPSARGISLTLPDGGSARHDGYFFAADVGGAIKGKHVDFFLGVTSKNPFPFVKSKASATFDAHPVSNAGIIAKLKALHTLA